LRNGSHPVALLCALTHLALPGAAWAEPPEAPAPAPMSAAAFTTQVKTIEQRVGDHKERIFRTKARLLLLQETVLGGDLSAGARAVLFHRNEMGGSFALESVAYALDGAPLLNRFDVNGDLDRQAEFEIFNGRLMPGRHQVAVRLVYRGTGYGVFSYLQGYRFTVQSSYAFNAEVGKITTVKVVGFEKGNFTTELKERPAVRYDIQVSKDGEPAPAPAVASEQQP
jgi:hypothetical protein